MGGHLQGYQRGGFTLAELMIVIAIVGILAAVAVPVFDRYVQKAKDAEAPVLLSHLANLQVEYHSRPRFWGASGSMQGNCVLHIPRTHPVTPSGRDKVPILDPLGHLNALGFATRESYFTIDALPGVNFCGQCLPEPDIVNVCNDHGVARPNAGDIGFSIWMYHHRVLNIITLSKEDWILQKSGLKVFHLNP